MWLCEKKSYIFSYEINSARNDNKFSRLLMKITISFTVSLEKDIFIIKILGDISNIYG